MYHKYIQSLSNLPPFANKIQWSISLYFDTLNILPISYLSQQKNNSMKTWLIFFSSNFVKKTETASHA